ncbi:MAG: MBL fold metallo-hydrolase, partial [Planctomycetota bacterium]
VQGNQRYSFPKNMDSWLEPGTSVVVTSGPNAEDKPPRVKWTEKYIWRNSGDPGQLLDSSGQVRAEAP